MKQNVVTNFVFVSLFPFKYYSVCTLRRFTGGTGQALGGVAPLGELKIDRSSSVQQEPLFPRVPQPKGPDRGVFDRRSARDHADGSQALLNATFRHLVSASGLEPREYFTLLIFTKDSGSKQYIPVLYTMKPFFSYNPQYRRGPHEKAGNHIISEDDASVWQNIKRAIRQDRGRVSPGGRSER